MAFTCLFFTTNEVLAQQVVNDAVKEEIVDTSRSQSLPVDITLLTSIAGTVGGLLYKDKRDKDSITAQLKEAIDVIMVLNACYIKFFNASMLYPEKNNKQILQLKSANNALEDSTLAAEMAQGITRYQKFAVGNFQLQMPNMQTPSPQVINATTVIPENKVATPPPPSPTPNNNDTT